VPYAAIPDQEDQYDPAILATMSDAVRKRMEAAWGDKLISIATRNGTLRGICENYRDAVDKRYYEDLEDKYSGYKDVTIRQFFNELNTVWVKKCLESDEETEEHYLRAVSFGQTHTVSKFAKDLDQEQIDMST
jgi:O6-methylguanine-DNA--protein-cysteine methyltransferase